MKDRFIYILTGDISIESNSHTTNTIICSTCCYACASSTMTKKKIFVFLYLVTLLDLLLRRERSIAKRYHLNEYCCELNDKRIDFTCYPHLIFVDSDHDLYHLDHSGRNCILISNINNGVNTRNMCNNDTLIINHL